MRRLLPVLLAACRMHGDVGAGSGSAAPPPVASHGHRELGMPILAPEWSADGTYVVFRVEPRDYEHWERDEIYLVVNAHTHALFELDHVSWHDFAPDRAHLVTIQSGQLAIYDLATGALVGDRAATAYAPVFAPDGRIAWSEQTAAGYRIHVRAIGGAESVLTGLPAAGDPREAVGIGFLGGDVIAWDDAGLRVWEHDAPIVSIDATIYRDVIVSADGVTYEQVVDDNAGAELRHIDLAAGERAPAALAADKVCGAGAIDRFEYLARCGDHRYLVRAPKAYCIWDVAHHRLQARIRSSHEEYHCTNDLVWLGDLPPGGPYDYYSALTGKAVGKPDDAPSYMDDEGPRAEPAGEMVDNDLAAKLGAAGHPLRSPAKDVIAGVLHDRAALWTADGTLVWQSPVPSEVGAVALSATDLIAVGRAGEVWHVDLATRALRSSQLPDCDMTEDEPIVAMPDGTAAVPCHTKANGRALRVEWSVPPIAEASDYGWYLTTATGSGGTVMGWLTYNGILARSLPSGGPSVSFNPAHYGLAITADSSRFATAEPVKGVGAKDYLTTYRVTIRDAKTQPISTAMLDDEPGILAFSTDGARLAVVAKQKPHVVVLDAATGAVVDDFTAESGGPPGTTRLSHLAWSPTVAARLAYYRTGPSRIVIRDVAAKRDIETRPLARPAGGLVRAVTWSPDGTRLALLADQLVTLWDGALPPVTFAFAGKAGVELRADGTARLLGDAAAASSMLTPQ